MRAITLRNVHIIFHDIIERNEDAILKHQTVIGGRRLVSL